MIMHQRLIVQHFAAVVVVVWTILLSIAQAVPTTNTAALAIDHRDDLDALDDLDAFPATIDDDDDDDDYQRHRRRPGQPLPVPEWFPAPEPTTPELPLGDTLEFLRGDTAEPPETPLTAADTPQQQRKRMIRDHWIFQPFRNLWRKVRDWIQRHRRHRRHDRGGEAEAVPEVVPVADLAQQQEQRQQQQQRPPPRLDDYNPSDNNPDAAAGYTLDLDPRFYEKQGRWSRRVHAWNEKARECWREAGCAVATKILPPLATVPHAPPYTPRWGARARDAATAAARHLVDVEDTGEVTSAAVTSTSATSSSTTTSTSTFGTLDFTGARGQPLSIPYFLHWNPGAAATTSSEEQRRRQVYIFSGERDARLSADYLQWIAWMVGGSTGGGASGSASGANGGMDDSVPTFLAWEYPASEDPRDMERALEVLAVHVLSLSGGGGVDGDVVDVADEAELPLLTLYAYDFGSGPTLRVAAKLEDHVYFVAIINGRVVEDERRSSAVEQDLAAVVDPVMNPVMGHETTMTTTMTMTPSQFEGLVVFVHGSEDRVTTLEQVRSYARRHYPRSSFVVELPGAGHDLYRAVGGGGGGGGGADGDTDADTDTNVDAEMARVTALEIRMLLAKPEKFVEVMLAPPRRR